MAAGFDSAEAQIEPSNSRVPNPFSESTYERPLGYRELANPKPVICSFPQQITEHEAESPACTIDELQDQRIFMDKEISLSDKFVAKLSLQNAGSESDVINDLARTLSESEKCGVEFQECLTENGAKRALMGEEVIKSEEFGYRVTSNGIPSQVANHEESYFNILGHNQEANGEKEGSMIRKMSKSDEIGAQSPQYPRTKICKKTESLYLQTEEVEEGSGKSPWSVGDLSDQKLHSDVCPQEDKYFYYDAPFYGETGAWIPVSVPPMTKSEHEEWSRGFGLSGGYLPDGDMSWSQLMAEDKELTLWDVVLEMLLVARGKVNAYTSGDSDATAWISRQLMEHAWREMSDTLTEANVDKMQKLLEAEPPKWLPDSTASSCMLCSLRFHPILCTRHHCRLCGGLFCGECSQGRSLLPEKFRIADPQRVCDVCSVRLQSVQPYLMDHVSRAAQLPTHDLTDLSTLRSWVNFPWGQSMEYEIYKAANTIRGYTKVGPLAHEKKIPEAILRDAKGLAIVTVVKVGMMVTYNIGTGLVVARREDGSWSPPSAISSFGLGWGAQAGGELTDFIIVLRTSDAVKTFSCDTHLSIGAGVSAAFGIIGRTAEADLRAGVGGCAACFTYSCSKGAFAGCSLEGSIVTTRKRENSRFYGSEKLNAYDILLGSLARPPAAATLYRALGYLYQRL